MTTTLDARGLLCPMPVIKVQNTLRDMAQGDELTVLCSDPGTKSDIPTWCRLNKHVLISQSETDDGNEITFLIRK